MFGWRVRPVLPVEHWLADGESLPFGKRAAEVIHTPGHTPGSCCFRVDDDDGPLLLAGDTLFQRSIGRTDLPGGDLADHHALDPAEDLHARPRHERHPRPRPAHHGW